MVGTVGNVDDDEASRKQPEKLVKGASPTPGGEFLPRSVDLHIVSD